MRRLALALLAVCSAASLVPAMVGAQDIPSAPELGAVVVEDPLSDSGVLRPNFCATGRNSARYVGDGFQLRVTGRCAETSTIAYVVAGGPNPHLPDGEVRVAVQLTEGAERARFHLWGRTQSGEGGGGYVLYWEPGRGTAELRRLGGGESAVLARRTDLGSLVGPGQAHAVALRFQGARIWALIEDRLVLAASDATFDDGGVGVALQRLGSPDDAQETTAFVRGLRLAALADAEQARVPTYQAPEASALPARASGFVPAPGTPPKPGDLIAEDPLTGPGMIPTGRCSTGNVEADHVDEGLTIKVRGRCSDDASSASGQTTIPGLRIPDGELRFDLKVAGATERAELVVFARISDYSAEGEMSWFAISPATGFASIGEFSDGTSRRLASRTDLAGRISADDWNTIAIRMLGDTLWLLVNDLPVLATERARGTGGEVMLRVVRTGDPDDAEESAVVLRNLRVSAIQGATPDRLPTYRRLRPRDPGLATVLSSTDADARTVPRTLVGVHTSR